MPYMCHLCPKRYKGRQILNTHRKVIHNFTTKEIESVPQLSLKCSYSYCNYIANSVKSLEHHITTVHLLVNFEAKEVKCPDCQKTFGCEASFYRHRRTYHGIGKSLPYINCNWPGCSYKTCEKKQFINHQKRHTGIKMFACEWPGCDYKSVTKSELDRHCERHNQKFEFKCHWPGCEYASKTGRYLKRHTITIHETTPYIHECHWPGCDKKFRFKQLLSIHVRNKHGLADKQCPRCPKMFKANRYLKDHMKIHDKS
ncbi:zinc finger protein 567-like [Oppia nitens]|uniref:zinc finger protein 567-like n=1 Tax=Oppia nitens TaxID=1686743 RepID=UPI0023DA5640|nr:zinc finger protein 567-like [Oppia nitens]